MRLPIAAILCSLACCVAAAAQAAPDQTFPYKAYVTADDVYVRSGPGDNYYPTDKLKAGDQVEVYRHDPGGWLAIRPVPGSFCWVAGRFLQIGTKNIATVSEEHVAARVGSRFSDIRDVIQVRLHRGELVECPRRQARRSGRRHGGQHVVQDCPAGGRVSLDLQPLRGRRVPPRRPAKEPRRRPLGGRAGPREPGADPLQRPVRKRS